MSVNETCDQDSVAPARYRVRTTRGPLYLCGHHYREHALMLGLMGYPVRDLTAPAPPALRTGTLPRVLGSFI